jgi:hypothetical protein
MFLVDGERVNSFDELASLASQDKYKNKEYVEVIALLFIAGG